jgi:hypothetical protein
MMEGVCSEAASLAAHLGPAQASVDLRQQPDHHRRQDVAGVQRRRRGAIQGLWLVCPARDRCQRSAGDQPRRQARAQANRQTVVHRARQPHRLRRADEAGLRARPTASRSAKRRSARPRNGTVGRPTRSSSCRRKLPSTCTNNSGTGRKLEKEWQTKFDAYAQANPALAGMEADPGPRSSGGLGQGHSDLPRRPEGARHARIQQQSAQCRCQEHPVAARRRRRPRAIDENADRRMRSRFRERLVQRTQFPFRHARARHDGHRSTAWC